MDLGTFWRYVDLLGGSTSRETMLRLETALGARPAAEIEGFGELLARLLHDLDTREHFRQEVSAFNEGDIEPEELTPDMFRDLRCAVVIAGRTRYEAVRADPSALERFLWPEVFDAVRLIDVLDAVYERSGLAPAYAPSVGIETGSNPAGLTPAELEKARSAAGSQDDRPWLQLDVGMEDPAFFAMFTEGADAWKRFDSASVAAGNEVLDDEGLRTEFRRHGVRALDVEFNLLPPESPVGTRIRRRGDRVEIDLQTHYALADADGAGDGAAVEAWACGLLRDAVSRAVTVAARTPGDAATPPAAAGSRTARTR